MRLDHVEIGNYRNIDGLVVDFEKDLSFVVGENNVGKTNLISGLVHIFIGKPFLRTDFYDEERPISVKFSLILNEEEIGIFDDLVDPTCPNKVNIFAIQETPDEYITYKHVETDEIIPLSVIKRMNVISYDSLRNPKNELDFSKTKGAGAFLNYVLNDYVKKNNTSLSLEKSEVDRLTTSVNETLKKLSSFKRFEITAQIEDNSADLISKVISLRDSNSISISETGYGVQFSTLIFLSLLERIADYAKHKKEYEKNFTTLLIFDEPEIHLHPYLQRALINDLVKIANGSDNNFNQIIHDYFNIDKIEAQIIIATHSPNMLSDDYRKIVRLFIKDDQIKAASGMGVSLSQQEEKQLLKQFEYIKEAVYSRCVIVVEGDSEHGCIKQFANKMGISFDALGIEVIKADGAESVLPIIRVLNKLGIKAVGIIDQDKKIEKNLPEEEYLFYTVSKCFDSEIVKALIENNMTSVLNSIITSWDSQSTNRLFQKNKINKIIDAFNFQYNHVNSDYSIDMATDDNMREILYVTWFAVNKGISLGKIIGEEVPCEAIPDCYANAINKAKEYSRQND